jgi:hypothetical protein
MKTATEEQEKAEERMLREINARAFPSSSSSTRQEKRDAEGLQGEHHPGKRLPEALEQHEALQPQEDNKKIPSK